MFRTRPPAYALACIFIWAVQCVLDLFLYYWLDTGVARNPIDLRTWQLIDLACTFAMGALLLLQLPRALRWRPRLNARPSPEVQHERERIGRDLHDQVGSQLVTAMALLDARDMAHRPALAALEQCMLDVRLLVDSMDGYDDTLADRLARLRHRIQPVLDRRGMQLEWDVHAWPHVGMPVGGSALELTNIVKEAISNVLQHSDATRLTVSLLHETLPAPGHAGGAWHLRIHDNGRGLADAAAAADAVNAANGVIAAAAVTTVPLHALIKGQGIAGMDRRARSAGGTLALEAGEGGRGLCVHVTVPDPERR